MYQSSIEEVEFALLEWVGFINHNRLLEPLGYLPTAENEEFFYSRSEAHAIGALLNLLSLQLTQDDSLFLL